MRTVLNKSKNLGLCDKGWRLVLKGLDSRYFGLGLAVTGDAGSLYPFWPGDRIRYTSAFWFLREQVVNVTLSKR